MIREVLDDQRVLLFYLCSVMSLENALRSPMHN